MNVTITHMIYTIQKHNQNRLTMMINHYIFNNLAQKTYHIIDRFKEEMKMQQRLTIHDKQTLKITINQVQMMTYTSGRDSYIVEPELQAEDELERKYKLLEHRNTILSKTTVQTWRTLFPIFNIIAILSLSGMQLGYGIIQITTVYDQVQLQKTYNFSPPIGLALGSMVSFMPIGAFFGSIFGKLIASRTSLKIAHLINNLLCMISSFALMQINLPGTLLAGRFLYGWCIACYCAWSPRYIQDLTPRNLKHLTSSIYSMWVVGSMMLGYFFGLIFEQNSVSSYYRIMFCFPGAIALIQLVMMLIFVPPSPRELFEQQLYEQGRRVLQRIYALQFVDMMVDLYRLEAEVKALKQTTLIHEQRNPYRFSKFRARFMAIYLNLFRQFAGINTILVYAGIIIGQTSPTFGPYTNFVITVIAFIATVTSHLLVIDRIGRRMVIIVSGSVFALCNLLIMIGMLTSLTILMVIPMIVSIFFFGITYSTVSSIYPSEILQDERITYTSLTAWPAMLMVTLIPPVIADVLSPTYTPWPAFLFFAVFSLLSVFYFGRFAVESKDRRYYDFIKEF